MSVRVGLWLIESFWKEFIQNGNNFFGEGGQTFVSIIDALVRIHRRDHPHQGAIGALARERVPEVVDLHLPDVVCQEACKDTGP